MGEGVYMGQHRWGTQRLALVGAQQHFLRAFFPTQLVAQVIVQCLAIFVAFPRVELNIVICEN